MLWVDECELLAVGRAEPLSAALCLFALWAYWRWMESKLWDFTYPTLFTGLMWAALLSKETAFTFFGVVALVDVSCHLTLWKNILSRRSNVSGQAMIPSHIFRVSFAAVNACLYLLFRKWLTVHTVVLNYRRLENPIAFSPYWIERLLSSTYLYVRYAGLLIWPSPLSCDYSFNCIPLVSQLLDSRNLLGAHMYASLIALVCILLLPM